MCEPGQLSTQTQALAAASDRQNFSLTLDRWVFKAQIEAPSPQRIAQTSFFVRTQDDKRNGRCSNRSQLGHRDLPGAKNLQQQGFDVVVDLVEFVDQEHARPGFIAKSAQQRPFRKEVQRVQPVPDLLPVLAEVGGLRVQKKLLQRLVEFSDDLLFGNSHVALQALNHGIGRRGHRIGQLSLATSWRTFHQQWLAHTGCQINHLQRDWIDDVACRSQLRGEFACRREQVGFLSSWKLHRKLCFCICWCADFAVIRQPCRWVPFHVGSAGAKRQIRYIGSKTMILLTRRLMPAELRLQSDRETQKSEIYFTDYTLAGQPGAYSFWKSDASRRSAGTVNTLRSDREALPYLFHRLHFDWATRGLFVLEVRREQTIRRDSQYIRVGPRGASIFISPITL